MENTALNGTTNATKNQEWKTKKGYGPIIVAASLALLLSCMRVVILAAALLFVMMR